MLPRSSRFSVPHGEAIRHVIFPSSMPPRSAAAQLASLIRHRRRAPSLVRHASAVTDDGGLISAGQRAGRAIGAPSDVPFRATTSHQKTGRATSFGHALGTAEGTTSRQRPDVSPGRGHCAQRRVPPNSRGELARYRGGEPRCPRRRPSVREVPWVSQAAPRRRTTSHLSLRKSGIRAQSRRRPVGCTRMAAGCEPVVPVRLVAL
jgi:hypothetical protein